MPWSALPSPNRQRRAGGGDRRRRLGVYPPPMEAALAKGWSAQSLAGLAGDASQMMSDIHADAQYRAHLVGVMARRAVAKAGVTVIPVLCAPGSIVPCSGESG